MFRFIVYFFIFCSLSSFAQVDSSKYQLLWEISGNGLQKPSYLFGSMHSNDARLFHFPDSLYNAFVNADAVVLETDISAIFDEYDVRINGKQRFSKRTITTSKSASTTVYGSEDGRPQFLDAYFQQTGFCAGKLFFPLESLQDQMDAMAQIDDLSPLTAINSLLFSKEAFINSYIQGDIASLSRMLKTQLGATPGAYEALISTRNRVMANGLDTLMRNYSLFCAVGSGHLHGSEGIIHLLRSKGYSLRAIVPTYSEVPVKEKQQMLAWKNYTLKNDSLGFELHFSGKPLVTDNDEFSYRAIYQELGQGNSFELCVYPNTEELADLNSKFIQNEHAKRMHWVTESGDEVYEGMVSDYSDGLQWKRIVVKNGRLYELTCFGGNKFMHSNRPQLFFNKLTLF